MLLKQPAIVGRFKVMTEQTTAIEGTASGQQVEDTEMEICTCHFLARPAYFAVLGANSQVDPWCHILVSSISSYTEEL